MFDILLATVKCCRVCVAGRNRILHRLCICMHCGSFITDGENVRAQHARRRKTIAASQTSRGVWCLFMQKTHVCRTRRRGWLMLMGHIHICFDARQRAPGQIDFYASVSLWVCLRVCVSEGWLGPCTVMREMSYDWGNAATHKVLCQRLYGHIIIICGGVFLRLKSYIYNVVQSYATSQRALCFK